MFNQGGFANVAISPISSFPPRIQYGVNSGGNPGNSNNSGLLLPQE